MPILQKIIISNFRNIEFQELEFIPNINCISGNNGEGKTNLLDAIYYLSMTKSYFSTVDKFNFRHETEQFTLSGNYMMDKGIESKFIISVNDKGDKKVKVDEKAYSRNSEHIGVLPIVMISPADSALVSESSQERRRFINSVLSQLDRPYLLAMQQYNRLLLQRNNMLKISNVDMDLLEVIDEKMSELADNIYNKRKVFIKNLSNILSSYYGLLSSANEEVRIEYKSDLDDGPLSEILAQRRDRDRLLKYTGAGIQRDDLIFYLNDYPIRKCGSQGQQKSFLVALKFAQYDLMKSSYGFPPILLLDDIFDKLDMERTSNLLSMVSSEDFGQIFISDSNKVRMKSIVDGFTQDSLYLEAVSGKFNRLSDV